MNEFLETEFVIACIRICTRVSDENGTSVHRNRPSHGLVYFEEGESLFEFVGAKSLTVKAGQIIYLPKYSNYDSTDAPGTTCIAVNFELADRQMTFDPFTTKCNFGNKYMSYFEKILQLWMGQGAGYQNGCLGILYNIIFHMHQDVAQEYKSYGHSDMLEKSTDYINSHITDPGLTVSKVAARAGISPEYLRKLFKAKYGVAPREYILNKRLERAKTMIECGDIKLSSIPYECGFTDYSYFARIFRRRLGILPLQYQKQTTGDGINEIYREDEEQGILGTSWSGSRLPFYDR